MFKLIALDRAGASHAYFYDPEGAFLVDEDGVSVVSDEPKAFEPAFVNDLDHAKGKSHALRRIRISMGLACNFRCVYCAQKDIVRTRPATDNTLKTFVAKLPSWYDGGKDGKGEGTQFEFWGGEPLVYWKTFKPLAERIHEMYPHAKLLTFTNGSLMDMEKARWFKALGFSVVISHDGPGQANRGPDPLRNPVSREAILWLYGEIARKGRMSFNSVMTENNYDVAKIVDFFRRETGDDDVIVGDAEYVSFFSREGREAFEAKLEEMRLSFYAAVVGGQAKSVVFFHKRVYDFLRHVIERRPASSFPQVCAMDTPHHIAVDLEGNVLTCQNASTADTSMNGSHRIGSVYDFDNIKLTTAKHWGARPHCRSCPFVAICQGGCMAFSDEDHAFNCRIKQTYSSVIMAAALYEVTGRMLSEVLPVADPLPFAFPLREPGHA